MGEHLLRPCKFLHLDNMRRREGTQRTGRCQENRKKRKLTLQGSAAFAGLAAILACAEGGSARAAIVISTSPTSNISCVKAICSPTATNAVLNAGDLATKLASSGITITTTGAGIQANDIQFETALSWANLSKLTLNAQRDLRVDQNINVLGTHGLTLQYGGTLSFGPGASVTFANVNTPLVINGHTYHLFSDLGKLAANIATGSIGRYYALSRSCDGSATGTCPYRLIPGFRGHFEGLGNTVSNLTINANFTKLLGTQGTLGFFGNVGLGGSVRDIGLINANISVSGLDDQGAPLSVGMLVGYSGGQVANSWATGSVSVKRAFSGKSYTVIGGLIGSSSLGSPGDVVNCHAAGGAVTFSGGTIVYAGGLVGSEGYGTIQTSSAAETLNISAKYIYPKTNGAVVGGLVGVTNGGLDRDYATGNITVNAGADAIGNTQLVIGGLVGELVDGGGTPPPVHDLYYSSGAASMTATVSGTIFGLNDGQLNIGGLIGNNGYSPTSPETLSTSYSVANLLGSVPHQTQCNAATSGGSLTICWRGGSVGEQDGMLTLADIYWNSPGLDPSRGVGSIPNFPGVTQLSTAQLQQQLPAGFDSSIWAIDPTKNGGYPYLIDNPPQ